MKKATFLQKITFEEGIMIIFMLMILIAAIFNIVGAFTDNKGSIDFLAKIGMGAVFGLFSGGYIYGLLKQNWRK